MMFLQQTGDSIKGQRFEQVFDTERGSKYARGVRNGQWMRLKSDETFLGPALYFGSIDPEQNMALYPVEGRVDKQGSEGIIRQILAEHVPGFVPHFVIGNHPIGVYGCAWDDITCIDTEKIVLQKTAPLISGIHVGHTITEVYKDIDMSYERPFFLERLLGSRFLTPHPPQFC
jgi:hypothetical protein